jgi:hypothetical protein
MTTLRDFLSIGQLGSVYFGMSKDRIIQVLGEPNDRSMQRNPEIWKYGSLQLVFHREKGETHSSLAFIGLYFNRSQDALPPALALSGWWPTENTTREEFTASLSAGDQLLNTLVAKEENDRLILKTGIEIHFEAGKLHSMQYAQPAKGKDKQIAIQLPEKVVSVLRKEAAQKNVSLSTLCAQWITQQATLSGQ